MTILEMRNQQHHLKTQVKYWSSLQSLETSLLGTIETSEKNEVLNYTHSLEPEENWNKKLIPKCSATMCNARILSLKWYVNQLI